MSLSETAPALAERGRRSRRSSEVKLYSIVSDGLRRQIRAGQAKPGDRLPSMEKLAEEFGVSLITVRKAVEVLEAEDLLTREQGRGTFVAHTANAREWLRISTTWDDLLSVYAQNRGRMENRVLIRHEGVALSPAGCVPDLAAPGGDYIFLRRVHRVDGLVYAFTDLYLDQEVYRLAPEAFEKDMVLRVLGTTPGVNVGAAFQRITISGASAEAADLLDVVTGAPVGELLRTVEEPSGRIIYRGRVTYRGDLVLVETRLK